MSEGIIGAVWAFCWGLAPASGALVGAILGLITHLRHRAIAAFMSLGAGVLLSAASFKVASEALISGRRGIHCRRNCCRCRYIQHRERSSRKRQRPQALRGMQAAAVGSRGAGQRHLHCARHRA